MPYLKVVPESIKKEIMGLLSSQGHKMLKSLTMSGKLSFSFDNYWWLDFLLFSDKGDSN